MRPGAATIFHFTALAVAGVALGLEVGSLFLYPPAVAPFCVISCLCSLSAMLVRRTFVVGKG